MFPYKLAKKWISWEIKPLLKMLIELILLVVCQIFKLNSSTWAHTDRVFRYDMSQFIAYLQKLSEFCSWTVWGGRRGPCFDKMVALQEQLRATLLILLILPFVSMKTPGWRLSPASSSAFARNTLSSQKPIYHLWERDHSSLYLSRLGGWPTTGVGEHHKQHFCNSNGRSAAAFIGVSGLNGEQTSQF